MKLNSYQQSIVDDTGCEPDDAPEIEDIMREDILHSTLDWLDARQFKKAAREAFLLFQATRICPKCKSRDVISIPPIYDEIPFHCNGCGHDWAF